MVAGDLTEELILDNTYGGVSCDCSNVERKCWSRRSKPIERRVSNFHYIVSTVIGTASYTELSLPEIGDEA
jgi:hypothetical protein